MTKLKINNQRSKILIILPGWGGSHETWADFVAEIAGDFRAVHVIDLPCFGTAPCPDDVWGVKEYARYAKERIAAFEYDAAGVVIMGHSFGGAVATYLVAHNPDICYRLILSGAAVFRPKRIIRRSVFWLIAKCGTLLFKLPVVERLSVWAKQILYKSAGSPDYARTSGVKRDIFRKIIRQDLRHLLPHITTPTLVVWGKNDSYVPLRYGKRIQKQIPNATLAVFDRGGHGLHLHNAKKLRSQILRFLH